MKLIELLDQLMIGEDPSVSDYEVRVEKDNLDRDRMIVTGVRWEHQLGEVIIEAKTED